MNALIIALRTEVSSTFKEHQTKFFRYINTYTSIIYTREYSPQGRFCCQKLGAPFIQFLQDITSVVSNSYFIKIQAFRL